MAFELRQKLISEIQIYQSDFSEEEAYKMRFLDLLKLEDCFHRSLLTGHITASSWIVNEECTAVILLHHAKLNKWLQPGGHADGDEDVRNVALKEAEEETGIEGFEFIQSKIFDLDIHTIPERKGIAEHEHFDIRFLLKAPEHAKLIANHESNQIDWISFVKLPAMISLESSLLRMNAKTQKFLSV
jgi:8-oxo-dGTP pyrophosphatase MutT (NUDIX family)